MKTIPKDWLRLHDSTNSIYWYERTGGQESEIVNPDPENGPVIVAMKKAEEVGTGRFYSRSCLGLLPSQRIQVS